MIWVDPIRYGIFERRLKRHSLGLHHRRLYHKTKEREAYSFGPSGGFPYPCRVKGGPCAGSDLDEDCQPKVAPTLLLLKRGSIVHHIWMGFEFRHGAQQITQLNFNLSSDHGAGQCLMQVFVHDSTYV